MAKYVLALDQGTTSSRAIVFNHEGLIVTSAQQEFPQIYPSPGLVEHDPEAIWSSQLAVAQEAMKKAGATASDIAAIGIANQRETTVVWDKNTGKPVANALVWQDTRVSDYVSDLARDGGQDRFRSKTGLPLATYFSGLKIRWLLEHVPKLRKQAEMGEVLFGNIDTFLLWNLTGGADGGAHVTDVTNASRTQVMNLQTLSWDRQLLNDLGVPEAMLPKIR